MSTESLFQSLEQGASVRIWFNGEALDVPAGINLAAALLAVGIRQTRSTPVTGAPRAPYCMMGVCFECLVEVDGQASRQACLLSVREGMQVRSQQGVRSLEGTGYET